MASTIIITYLPVSMFWCRPYFATVSRRGVPMAWQCVLVIPHKRQPRPLAGFLTRTEIDALLAAPDRSTWLGRRDHSLLTGLRLTEITSLRQQDVSLAIGRMSAVKAK